jgi:MFS family permease
MLEPVLAFFLQGTLGESPGRIGLVFGTAAIATTILHPILGRLADRWGGSRLTLIGLFAIAAVLPFLGRASSYTAVLMLYVAQASALALVITPSLAYMAEATTASGVGSFGVAYGLYNMAWGAGLLGGPALGGFLYDRVGFPGLALGWAAATVVLTAGVARVQSKSPLLEELR